MSEIKYEMIKRSACCPYLRRGQVKGGNPQADTSALEGEIDQLVAPRELYGLTEDEVRIVEGSK